MRTVHKFRLKSGAELNKLKLREGFRLLHSEYLVTEKAVFVWIEVPLDITRPEQEVHFRVFRTGDPVPRNYEHLATAVDAFGPEAFHVYVDKAPDSLLEQAA